MDFIHKIISERRAARMVGSAPPAVVEPGFDNRADPAPRAEAPVPESAGDRGMKTPGFAAPLTAAEVWGDPLPDLTPKNTADDFARDDRFEQDLRSALTEPAEPANLFDEDFQAEAAEASEVAEIPTEILGWDRPVPLKAAAPPLASFESTVAARGPAIETPSESPVHVPSNQRSLNEMHYVSVRPQAPQADQVLTDAGVQMPPPAAGRGSSRSGHVKTRLLGFNPESLGLSSPFDKADAKAKADAAFPVGWLVVVAGPGHGASFVLHDGVARIGRGEDQEICLNFGDSSISRDNHLSIAFDSEQNGFFIGQSGRSNIVRLNNKPLLSTEQVRSGDQIRVGETTLRLAALCGEDFSWARKV